MPPLYGGRLRLGSGTSWELLSDSPRGYILRNWKILTLQKAWPQCKLGDPNNMASQWHTSFCQKQGKDSEFPYIQSIMALSQNPDLRDSCLMSFSCLPISWPLCLSPSDFLDQSFWTYHIRMLSRKGFGGSLWSRSFFYIQKPEGSKTVLTF